MLNFYKYDSSNIYTSSRKIPIELKDLTYFEPDWKLLVNFYGYEDFLDDIEFACTWYESGYTDSSGAVEDATSYGGGFDDAD